MESDSDKSIFEQYAELVRRFKAGDENAFTEIYEKSKRLVYTTCYGILNNEQDAEDAMQETYTAVFLKLAELEDENVFLQWLKRIAANKAHDKYKVRKGDLSYDDAVAAGEDIEGDDNLEDLPDSYVMDKTKRDALLKIIKESLKDAEFQTVLLFYYNELSRKDIAEVMGCSEETIKDRLSKSRKKIKAGITEYERVNKDKLMGAAAGVPFLTRFFTESFKDIPVPQTKFIPPKAVPNASPAGAVKGTAAKAVVKAGEKAVVQSAVRAGFLATATGKIIAVVAAIAVALGAVVTGAVLIKRSKDNVKRDYKIDYDGIYSFVDEDENVNNCLRFYPDGDLIYTSYEFDDDEPDNIFPTGSWFTIESDDDRVDEGTYEVEDGELVINIDHDPDPIIFTGELDETGVILTPESDPDADPLVYEFVSFDDLPDYEPEAPEEEEFILDRTVMNWNGHSYALFDGYGSWEEAEAYCESMGGHLATITSQEENDAVYTFAQSMSCDNVYIGYSDTAEEGIWTWVNGEESDYANWNEGEPNGFSEGENYALMVYNGCWYDSEYTPSYENGPIIFVCEWDSEVTGTENINVEDIVLPEPEETEPAESLETAAEIDQSDPEMYNAYLQILESKEPEIADAVDYFSEFSDLLPCSLIDINNDGIEELCFVTYPLKLNIYSYDEQTGSAYEMGFISMTYGTDVLFALTSDGSIFQWSDANFPNIPEPFHDGDYDLYSADTLESIGHSAHHYDDDFYGECYDFAESSNSNSSRFYNETEGNITSEVIDEFDQTTSGLLDSMTVLLVNSGGADRDFNNDRINEAASGINSVAMTYDDMHSVLLGGPLPVNGGVPSGTAQTFNPGDRNEINSAYLDKVNQISSADFTDEWGESHYSGTVTFDLVYINNDDIPELICSTYPTENYARTGEQTFTYTNVYTYYNGQVIEIAHMLVDNVYYPKENIITDAYFITDHSGANYYISVIGINDEGNGSNTTEYQGCIVDLDLYPDIWSGLESGASDEWHYYYIDPSTYAPIEITEAEYYSRTTGTGDSVDLSGTMTLDQITAELS